MIRVFQCPGLRKHPGVGLVDLSVTERLAPPTLVNRSFKFLSSSAVHGGVVDEISFVFKSSAFR